MSQLSFFDAGTPAIPWVSVLVDCPAVQGLFTYAVPPALSIGAGDILSVPFGSQFLGGIAVGFPERLSPELTAEKMRPVDDVVVKSFFTPHFWQLLHWVADYYCTDLMTVIRMALPPGLLERSQRRIRLHGDRLPDDWERQLTGLAHASAPQIVQLLQAAKHQDYSYRYLHQQVKQAQRGLRELLQRGWVESYLEPPKAIQPKAQKVVTLISDQGQGEPTDKQKDVLAVLRQQGGEQWLSELCRQAHCGSSVVELLAKKGYVTISQREKLRLLAQPTVNRDQPQVLTPAQQQALTHLQRLRGCQRILLHGVTGSGKTEVYLQAIAPVLQAKKSALVLVPEIGLTPQLTDRFRARFGNKISVYHSALSDGERYDTWRQMLIDEARVVIGTRSAVFAPLPNLGLIILDEEHDSSFKQTQPAPTYHARLVAQQRAQLEDCPLILGSATPALETWQMTQAPANQTPAHYLHLPERIYARPMPPVKIVDMRRELKTGNRSIFSRDLQSALENLQIGEQQAILFISRRGHSTFVSCRSCGEVLNCPHCDVSLSYHYTHAGANQLLRCHYCNYAQAQPRFCPQCQSPYLKFFGSGTQKVTQALTDEFPHLRWLRFDGDTTQRKGEHRRLLEEFRQGNADILVGTQMLTKGLDLEQVTLVGIVAADSLLNFADYRSAERAFQTLTQVAGRAGRGNDPGQVILQTYSPDHPVLEAVKRHDYQSFIAQELPQRQALNYPPYGYLVLIRLSGANAQLVEDTAQAIAVDCQAQFKNTVEILGPAPASILRVADQFRWHLLLKSPLDQRPKLDLEQLRQRCPASVSLAIDVDPLYID